MHKPVAVWRDVVAHLKELAAEEDGCFWWRGDHADPRTTVQDAAERAGLVKFGDDGGWGTKAYERLTKAGWIAIGREPPVSPAALVWRHFLHRIGVRRA